MLIQIRICCHGLQSVPTDNYMFPQIRICCHLFLSVANLQRLYLNYPFKSSVCSDADLIIYFLHAASLQLSRFDGEADLPGITGARLREALDLSEGLSLVAGG